MDSSVPDGGTRHRTPSAILAEGLAQLGVDVGAKAQAQMLEFLSLLREWNRSFNLTAIRDPNDMVVRHLLDSLSVVPFLRPGALIDVGSGPGVPGLVFAMVDRCRPVTVVDSNGKKARFMREAVRRMALDNVRVEQARVEQLPLTTRWPQVISRAFSDLDQFVRLAGGLLEQGGVMLAMKGRRPDDEITKLDAAWRVDAVRPLQVPGLDAERCLVELVRVDAAGIDAIEH